MSGLTQKATSPVAPKGVDDLTHRTLIIGDLSRWNAQGRDTADFAQFQFINLQQLTTKTLIAASPEMILSPMVGDDFDVVVIAGILHNTGYAGRYRAVTAGVQDAEIVRSEVAAVAPALDFDLLELPLKPD